MHAFRTNKVPMLLNCIRFCEPCRIYGLHINTIRFRKNNLFYLTENTNTEHINILYTYETRLVTLKNDQNPFNLRKPLTLKNLNVDIVCRK